MNNSKVFQFLVLAVCSIGLISGSAFITHAPRVNLKRVPDEGIQPEVAVGRDGSIHVVYFKGDPSEGDLFYVNSKDGLTFSEPIRVNSVPGSAVAIGNIRGARIAVGRTSNVYIVWNGSRRMADPVQGLSPMLFSRLNKIGTAFEPQRNLIQRAYGIDGGGSVAADQQGRVYVFWHAPIPGTRGEQFRRIWMTQSLDDGNTFQPEQIAWDHDTGVCSCCSLDAYISRTGAIYVLFRSANKMVDRDMYLLDSRDYGATFRGSDISKWNVGYCVMSSEGFISGIGGTFAAWETEKQIRYSSIEPGTTKITDRVISPSETKQKYPSLAMNRDGLLLIAWTEGMGWKQGGSVDWLIVDRRGEPAGKLGSASGVPAWSLVAAYPLKNGSFVILY